MPDSTRIQLLFKSVYAYQNNVDDSCMAKAQQAMALVTKPENNSFRCDAYNWMGTAYNANDKPDSAYFFFTKALNCAKSTNSIKAIASAINNLGVYYASKGNHKRAIRFYNLSLKIRKENGITESISSNYNNRGNAKESLGDFVGAIRDFKESLRIKRETHDSGSIAITHSNLAKVYFMLNNYKEARKHIQQSWYWSSLAGNLIEKFAIINLEGVLAYSENNFIEAEKSFLRGLKIAEELNSTQNQILILANLSEIENILGKYDQAIHFGKKGLELVTKNQSAEYLTAFYYNIAQAYLSKKDRVNALKYALTNISSLKQHPSDAYQIIGLQQLSEAYELNGNHQKALEVYKEYSAQKNQSDLKNSEAKIKKIELEIENREQLLKINRLESEKKIYDQQLKQNAIVGLLLFFIIVVLTISVIQIRKSRKAKIEDNLLISKQAEELQVKADELQHLNEVKDKMFSILSHDLKNPLVSFQQTLFLLEEDMLEKEELPYVIQTLKEKFGNLNLLLENLLNWSKARIREHRDIDFQKIALQPLVIRSVDLLKQQAELKNITLKEDVRMDHQILADMNQMDMIIRNLLTNAIKFSPEGSSIEVRSRIESDNLLLEVIDQGTGMDQTDIERILRGEVGVTKAGTRGEQGSGIGLSLVKEFIEANKGKLEILSEKGKGSCFRISFEAV
ncbi:hypothetical protein MASR2M44_01400 [Bacteroidota bacterium]